MSNKRFKSIYVHIIDGTSVWIPMPAKWIEENIYQIMDSSEFDPSDAGTLLEFIPGDKVKVTEGIIGKQKTKKLNVATELVSSFHPDKGYFDFLFKVFTKKLPSSIPVLEQHQEIIERIKAEITAGKFHYPFVIQSVDSLTNLSACQPKP